MREIIDALKYWMLYKLEVPAPEINRSDSEITYLRNELTIAREEISRLTNLIYNYQAPTSIEVNKIDEEELEPIRGQYTPWHVTRRKLEAEDRIKAAQIRKEAEANTGIKVSPINIAKVAEAIEELENELGVTNDASR
jgi:hypothetical protein